MNRDIIETKKAPAAVGPYSQAVKSRGLVFVSAQLPLEAETAEMVENDIKIQTYKVLDNLKQILYAAGSSLDQTLKVTIFITDMKQFPIINEIYETYFPIAPPARACVEVAGLPKGALVEIEAIALSRD